MHSAWNATTSMPSICQTALAAAGYPAPGSNTSTLEPACAAKDQVRSFDICIIRMNDMLLGGLLGLAELELRQRQPVLYLLECQHNRQAYSQPRPLDPSRLGVHSHTPSGKSTVNRIYGTGRP